MNKRPAMSPRSAQPHPPRLARKLLRKRCAPQWLEEIEGDLEEQFQAQIRENGLLKARLIYSRDVLLLATKPYLRNHPVPTHHKARGPFMLTNYSKIALRNFRKHKGYAFINITGLAVSLACCLLIVLYVQDEHSYDRFHEKSDRIYRVVNEVRLGDKPGHWVWTAIPLAPALETAFPDIEHAVRFISGGLPLMRRGDRVFYEERAFFTDPSIFEVFSFNPLRGNPKTALNAPFSVVLTETLVAKYFPNEDPLGQTLTISVQGQEMDYTVTGVVPDVPGNSHLQFSALLSFATYPAVSHPHSVNEWRALNVLTYVLLHDSGAAAALDTRLPHFLKQQTNDDIWYTPYLQPLTDIHFNLSGLGVQADSDVRYLYIFSAIALFILLIACINYMNLATARSASRAREIGVRKFLGAHRMQLTRQFLGESVLLSGIALLLALVLLAIILPVFNSVTEKSITLTAYITLPVLLTLVGVSMAVGVLAGSYPALFLSRFRPVVILRGRGAGGSPRAGLRKVLVVVQFAITLVLLIGTVVIYNQMQYIRNKHLGFDDEHVVVLPLKEEALQTQANTLKQTLLDSPYVLAAGLSGGLPSRGIGRNGVTPEGAEETQMLSVMSVDFDFLETLGMTVQHGRGFSQAFARDSAGFVINEATARAFGWEEPLGKKLNRNGQIGPVLGVLEDFHFASLHQTIEPIVLYVQPEEYAYLSLKLDARNLGAALATVEAIWHKYAAAYPFDYAFLNDTFDRLYRADYQFGWILGTFASMAILIACLGLFGLAAFTTEQRTKEIGIRKVLGASIPDVLVLITKDFTGLVLIAIVVATPIAYSVMTRWLDDFAYRIEISWPIFLVAGLTALGIAWVTISYQSIKAALANPVTSLRHE